MNKYKKKRDKILDKIIELRNQYFDLLSDNDKKNLFIVRTGNECMKYAKTQDPPPQIPQIYFIDLASDIDVGQKIGSLVSLIEKQYWLTDQEREFLKSLEKDYNNIF